LQAVFSFDVDAPFAGAKHKKAHQEAEQFYFHFTKLMKLLERHLVWNK
jgi:hypothetical protein